MVEDWISAWPRTRPRQKVVLTNDLGVERSGLLGRVVLRVGTNIASADVLDGDVLHVEANVVSYRNELAKSNTK